MAGIRAAMAVVLLGTVLGACPAPGEGVKARRGEIRAAPVIEALRRYRLARGRYPETLESLVPEFLADPALKVPDHPQEAFPLEYQRADTSYVLTYRYVGPGMNYCRYRPERPRWECGGYF